MTETLHHRFPDPDHCKTHHFRGILFQCKSEEKVICPYAAQVGHDHYCHHPDGPEFQRG